MGSEQKSTFLESEGDAWFKRNVEVLTSLESDFVFEVLKTAKLKPRNVLEIGCSNGWRLNMISKLGADRCCGVEPGEAAVEDGNARYKGLELVVGTADDLPFNDDSFDLVIIGCCLYLCDPSQLFKISSEVDRVLQDRGFIVLVDFCPPTPYSNRYSHYNGIKAYKMDYSKLFLWHPHYTLCRYEGHVFHGKEKSASEFISGIDDQVGLHLIGKNSDMAFPANPYK